MHLGNDIETLADRIKLQIAECGICDMNEDDVSVIWGNNRTLSESEKRLHVQNFSFQYRLTAIIDMELTSFIFRKTN